jgi:hypothetical protein
MDYLGLCADSYSIVFLITKGITGYSGSSATILQYSMNVHKGPKNPSISLFAQPNGPQGCLFHRIAKMKYIPGYKYSFIYVFK